MSLLVSLSPAAANGSEPAPANDTLERVSVHGRRVRDPAWVSYRDSYTAMQMYHRAVPADAPLEPRFQLRPLTPTPPASDDLQLRLVGTHTDRPIALTALWGTVPLDDAAVADGADFTLNTPPGTFSLKRIIAVKRTESGEYSDDYLRNACTEALAALRRLNIADRVLMAFKTCKGVRFYTSVQPEASEPTVSLAPALQPRASDAPADYQLLEYRFSAAAVPAHLKLPFRVIAITPIHER